MSKKIIGIDLGTTYSCVSVWKNGNVEIIPNDQGNRITPSYVAFTDTERLVGNSAKNQANSNPLNTIYDAKRLIGRQYNDDVVQKEKKELLYKITEKDTKPSINVIYKGEKKEFTPEQISAMILSKLKETAEAYLGHKVEKAVVTVPAYFNNSQRQATKDAGTIAGLEIVRVINEPTAAALAFGLNKKQERKVLIYDLGGGTFDVSILNADGEIFEVLSTCGDSHLGGSDFDRELVNHCVKEFKKKYKIDISKNSRAIRRLKSACENAKRSLSSSTTSTIQMDALHNGIDFSTKITRAKFERLCESVFKKTLEPVKTALHDADLSKSDIDDIVLVGGSTRIPKVKSLLKEFFNGKELCQGVNPDEAVAIGAAIQGSVMMGGEDAPDLVVCDVNPLSLGIETVGGIMTKLIPKNSSIPCTQDQTFSTNADNQPAVTIQIYEGERSMTKYCNKLGEFNLSGIPPARRGVPKIKVTFDMDNNGILTVSAKDESTGNDKKLKVKTGKENLSSEEIDKMLKEEKEFEEEDKKIRECVEAKSQLETYAYTVKSSIEETKVKEKLSEEDVKLVEEKTNEILDWLDDTSELSTKEDYENKRKEFESTVGPIMAKLYGGANTMPPNGMPTADETTNKN